MRKPTYYLRRSDFSTQEEFARAKERFAELGFRVAVYVDGPEEKNICDGLKQLIRNHSGRHNFGIPE